MAAERAAIVAEALTWDGTPFHDCSGVKGVGCDCVHLLEGVFKARGYAMDFEMPVYPPQWGLHRDEPMFLSGLARYARQVERADIADIAMFRFGRHAAHGGILIGNDRIVHASSTLGRVSVGALSQYLGRLDSYWSVFA
jgi:NlpC/P60 family putative phage cell wall peptidase